MITGGAGPPLTPEEAIRYLLDVGHLTDREIVVGEVRAEPISGRNRSVRVVLSDRPGYFIKQAEPGDDSARATLAREAAFYRRLQRPDAPPALRSLLPEFVRHEPERDLLAIGLVPDACNAHELDDAEGATPYPRIGALVGDALATCHAVRRDGPRTMPLESLDPPWVLEVAHPGPAMLRDFSSAQVELVKQVQTDPRVHEALEQLRGTWVAEVLMHGDLKWGNVLVRASPPALVPERLWLIDWEYASWGDPAWDLGSAIHSFVADCIHVVSHDAAGSAGDARDAFQRALPIAQEQIRQLWVTYRRGLALAGAVSDERIRRSLRCAGARLLQSSYEWCHGEYVPPRNAVAALQLSLNLLRAPLPAVAALLGLADQLGGA